jgi:transposase
MIMLPSTVRIFLCTRPTDMRKSFDGLFGMVREFLGQDPLSGHLFLFLNRRRDRAKILLWDRDGLVIWYKRLEAGTFQSLDPASRTAQASGAAGLELSATELALILGGVDLASARQRKRYSRPAEVHP